MLLIFYHYNYSIINIIMCAAMNIWFGKQEPSRNNKALKNYMIFNVTRLASIISNQLFPYTNA